MFRQPKPPGWLSVLMRDDALYCAHVVRDARGVTLEWAHHELRVPGASDVQDLRKLRARLPDKNHRCATLIMRGTYQTFNVPAPKVDPSEMRDALRWVIKDDLEFPLEQAMIDSVPIPADGASTARDPMTFVIAARRDVVADRIQVFQRAGIELSAITVAVMAQRDAAALFETPGRGLAFLGLHAVGALLTFTCDGSICASRFIPYLRDDLRQHEDADRRQTQVERLVLEVQRALDSFQRQFSHVSVQRLVLAAPAGHVELLSSLRQTLDQTIELADLRTVMDVNAYPKLKDIGEQADWILTIGMALRVEETA